MCASLSTLSYIHNTAQNSSDYSLLTSRQPSQLLCYLPEWSWHRTNAYVHAQLQFGRSQSPSRTPTDMLRILKQMNYNANVYSLYTKWHPFIFAIIMSLQRWYDKRDATRNTVTTKPVIIFSLHRITRPTQPPTFCGTGNKYRPTCGDALRLGSKGRMARSIYG